jgi:hypothetical protein
VIFIGIDNGVSGSIGAVDKDGALYFSPTPVKKELNYQKSKVSFIHRIDFDKMQRILMNFTAIEEVMVSIERPMINAMRFQASVSAARSLEATLIVLESLKIPFQYIDSKQWQIPLLPKGIKGTDQQKAASLAIGNRLFPAFTDAKHPDRDGLLIAEYMRRNRVEENNRPLGVPMFGTEVEVLKSSSI